MLNNAKTGYRYINLAGAVLASFVMVLRSYVKRRGTELPAFVLIDVSCEG